MTPVIDDLIQEAANTMHKAYRAGYRRAIDDALSRMMVVASVVPESVTKQWIINEIGRQADELKLKARRPDG